jgi:hypothetical protein
MNPSTSLRVPPFNKLMETPFDKCRETPDDELMAKNDRKKNGRISFFILSLLIVVSCEKKETPVKPYDRGGLTVSTIDMGSNYDNQHYYDLGTGKIVKSNLKTDWDFSYTCDGCGGAQYLQKHIGIQNVLLQF